jgi:molybdopterin/thiamine biosynthesis adenylyltransferase
MNNYLSRQEEMIPTDKITSLKLLIIGVGGIGSSAAYVLASMGVRDFTLIDPDFVEDVNIFPGWFNVMNVGIHKVDVVQEYLEENYDLGGGDFVSVTAYPGLANEAPITDEDQFDIILACTDNIPSRQWAWEHWAGQCKLWLDARMGGTTAHLFAIDPLSGDDRSYYEGMFYSEPAELPCGMKATAALTKGFIPGMIAEAVRNHILDKPSLRVRRYDLDDGIYAK